MIEILIATPIRSWTEGASRVSVEAGSVREAMDRLISDYPRLKQQLYNESGTLRSFVGLFLNGEDIHLRDGLMSRVNSGDTLEILLAISGGSHDTPAAGTTR